MKIDEEIKTAIEPEMNKAGIARIDVINGYLNIYLDKGFYIKSILNGTDFNPNEFI